MEALYRWVAGIDVHKKMLAVVVRAPQGEYVQRKFGTTKMSLARHANRSSPTSETPSPSSTM